MLQVQTEDAAKLLGVAPATLAQFSRRLPFACEKDGRGRLWWGAYVIAEAVEVRRVSTAGVAAAIEVAAKRCRAPH